MPLDGSLCHPYNLFIGGSKKMRREKMLVPKTEESVPVEGLSVAQSQTLPERLSIDLGFMVQLLLANLSTAQQRQLLGFLNLFMKKSFQSLPY